MTAHKHVVEIPPELGNVVLDQLERESNVMEEVGVLSEAVPGSNANTTVRCLSLTKRRGSKEDRNSRKERIKKPK